MSRPVFHILSVGNILVISGKVSIYAATWALYHAGVSLLPVIVLSLTVLTAYPCARAWSNMQ